MKKDPQPPMRYSDYFVTTVDLRPRIGATTLTRSRAILRVIRTSSRWFKENKKTHYLRILCSLVVSAYTNQSIPINLRAKILAPTNFMKDLTAHVENSTKAIARSSSNVQRLQISPIETDFIDWIDGDHYAANVIAHATYAWLAVTALENVVSDENTDGVKALKKVTQGDLLVWERYLESVLAAKLDNHS